MPFRLMTQEKEHGKILRQSLRMTTIRFFYSLSGCRMRQPLKQSIR